MNRLDQFKEVIGTYEKHGWRLRRVLMRDETARTVTPSARASFGAVAPEISEVDALWFARPSHAEREAWELRLVAETPYALFETFEPDEAEEDREEVRREMLCRLRDFVEGN